MSSFVVHQPEQQVLAGDVVDGGDAGADGEQQRAADLLEPGLGCVPERVAGVDVDAGRGRGRVHASDDLEFGFVDGGADDGEQRVGHFVHDVGEAQAIPQLPFQGREGVGVAFERVACDPGRPDLGVQTDQPPGGFHLPPQLLGAGEV